MTGISGVDLGLAVVDRLLDWSVDEVVVAPGSRNAPLSMAAWAAEQAGRLRLRTRIDERSAAFLALGLAKVHTRAAVVSTSGTAVANLHPAVLEAAHSGLQLVVVTADRPARMRATGANQTTDQVGIFGRLVETVDIETLADLEAVDWPMTGPLHLNIRLDEPLVAAGGLPSWPAGDGADGEDEMWSGATMTPVRRYATLPDAPWRDLRTVVVAGDDAGPMARMVAQDLGWPLLAEPSSGARTGDNAIRTYRLLLGGRLGREVQRVVVAGRPTLSRPVTRLLAREEVEVRVLPGRGAWPYRRDDALAMSATPDARDTTGWLQRWQEADRALGRKVDQLLAEQPALTPYDVAGAVFRALPAGGLLVVGASSPIRDLDIMARPAPVGERRKVIANRGLAGIDGTISTAIGAALGRPDSRRALALMGDVTFLHDQSSLVLGPEEERPDLTIVVVNDDGGSIFSMLEQGAPEHAAAFERLFGTPHGVDLASLCAATRTPHLRVATRPELEQALASPNGGIEVVEAAVDRRGRRDLDAAIRSLATTVS